MFRMPFGTAAMILVIMLGGCAHTRGRLLDPQEVRLKSRQMGPARIQWVTLREHADHVDASGLATSTRAHPLPLDARLHARLIDPHGRLIAEGDSALRPVSPGQRYLRRSEFYVRLPATAPAGSLLDLSYYTGHAPEATHAAGGCKPSR